VKVKAEPSALDISRLAGATSIGDDATAEALAALVVEWNFLGTNGEPWPPSGEALQGLKGAVLESITEAIWQVLGVGTAPPNDSGAPSAASSPESASPTRTKTRKPTT